MPTIDAVVGDDEAETPIVTSNVEISVINNSNSLNLYLERASMHCRRGCPNGNLDVNNLQKQSCNGNVVECCNDFKDNNFNAENLLISKIQISSVNIPSEAGYGRRGVTFPENNFISGYLEPPNPWKRAPKWNRKDILYAYVLSCDKHKTKPLSKVLQQLDTFSCNGEREKILSFKGERLDVNQCEPVEEILRRVQFNCIDLEGCHLDDKTSDIWFDMIEFYESACCLNISFNKKIGVRGWQGCAKLLRRTPCLTSLSLRNCDLDDRTVLIFGRALKMGCYLTVLHMENMYLSGRPLVHLVVALKTNETLQELFLADNRLSPSDGIPLGKLLKYNHSLSLLDLCNNNLQDVGVGHICQKLAEERFEARIKTLILRNNHMSYRGAHHICDVLVSTCCLQTLKLGHNAITNEGVHILKEGLLKNKFLVRLGMQSARLTCEGAVALAEYMADTSCLEHLDLRENDIRTAGQMALALSLRVNQSVTSLDIDTEAKKEQGVKDFADHQSRLQAKIQALLVRNQSLALQREDVGGQQPEGKEVGGQRPEGKGARGQLSDGCTDGLQTSIAVDKSHVLGHKEQLKEMDKECTNDILALKVATQKCTSLPGSEQHQKDVVGVLQEVRSPSLLSGWDVAEPVAPPAEETGRGSEDVTRLLSERHLSDAKSEICGFSDGIVTSTPAQDCAKSATAGFSPTCLRQPRVFLPPSHLTLQKPLESITHTDMSSIPHSSLQLEADCSSLMTNLRNSYACQISDCHKSDRDYLNDDCFNDSVLKMETLMMSSFEDLLSPQFYPRSLAQKILSIGQAMPESPFTSPDSSSCSMASLASPDKPKPFYSSLTSCHGNFDASPVKVSVVENDNFSEDMDGVQCSLEHKMHDVVNHGEPINSSMVHCIHKDDDTIQKSLEWIPVLLGDEKLLPGHTADQQGPFCSELARDESFHSSTCSQDAGTATIGDTSQVFDTAAGDGCLAGAFDVCGENAKMDNCVCGVSSEGDVFGAQVLIGMPTCHSRPFSPDVIYSQGNIMLPSTSHSSELNETVLLDRETDCDKSFLFPSQSFFVSDDCPDCAKFSILDSLDVGSCRDKSALRIHMDKLDNSSISVYTATDDRGLNTSCDASTLGIFNSGSGDFIDARHLFPSHPLMSVTQLSTMEGGSQNGVCRSIDGETWTTLDNDNRSEASETVRPGADDADMGKMPTLHTSFSFNGLTKELACALHSLDDARAATESPVNQMAPLDAVTIGARPTETSIGGSIDCCVLPADGFAGNRSELHGGDVYELGKWHAGLCH